MESKWVQKPDAENEISKGISFGQAVFKEDLGLGVNVQDGEILRAKGLSWQRAVGRNLPTGGAGEQVLEWDLQGRTGWEGLHHTPTANRWSSLTRYSVTIALRSLSFLVTWGCGNSSQQIKKYKSNNPPFSSKWWTLQTAISEHKEYTWNLLCHGNTADTRTLQLQLVKQGLCLDWLLCHFRGWTYAP